MTHPLYDVTHFETVNDYTLRVVFDDNSEQVINFEGLPNVEIKAGYFS